MARLRFLIRGLLIGFMVGLVLSGVTAFPLPQELALLTRWMGIPEGASSAAYSGLTGWIVQVRNALQATDAKYPFLFYGTDWLAFAHIVIAILFVGPYRDPVRNVWVIEWGMVACVLVLPLALICGPLRDIPVAWRIIDCSFGVVGIVPLLICRNLIRRLEKLESDPAARSV
ncbi:hypothetical protein BH11ARM2_BH11ARM2_22140 [soil metagenome]